MNLIILKVWSEYFRAGEIQSRKSSQSFTITERTEGKEVCLNIQNNDEKCFLWSILASLHPLQHKNHPDKVSKCQEYEHELNMVGVRYPVDIKVIWKFEHQNNISVNVYGYKDKKLFLLRTTTVTTARHHVNLLYITSGKTSHYVLVKDLSRLASSQYNNNYHEKHFCQYSLHGCISKEVLKNHLGRCQLHGAQRIKLPKAGDKKGCYKVKFL